MMLDLQWLQIVLVGLTFVWSGFVRTGIGFGGALMSLPLLLLIDNRPLVYLPIVGAHLLFFACIAVLQSNRRTLCWQRNAIQTIDWPYVKRAISIMIVPKLIGVFGLLTLPTAIMSSIIFGIVLIYSITFILNRPFRSTHPALDWVFLMLGGYISGTSLIGAPLVVAVTAEKVEKTKLRDTLFAIWIILVSIKMGVFIYSGIDLQLASHLWLLPCASIGHILGMKLHDFLQQKDSKLFFRILGALLFITSLVGLLHTTT